MGMISKLEIEESLETMEKALITNNSFKVRQRIQSLILLKKDKFKRQADLAEFIGVGHSTLKTWIKQYKEYGFDSLTTIQSGGNYKGIIDEHLHKALKAKLNDSKDPFLGYWHAVDWVKEHHGQDINYQTLRAYMIRHFQTRKKHLRKSHHKKDEQVLVVSNETP
ncbi:Helix-turn-helix domain-containing protein [Arenibacter nanhaiticus]|uniref:Helix-turn-helix domain-containing protein n=1 Tax=Arenibacter nanhaiticus TaxID=558155 RepID=A0A1M6N042_9FLAO|nr:helix-turn-helix domain-containing protein [Arenibacter nanhaiticus]SHJ89089.1 Helix-turn-helix domain-containing protein [Arenibacter nanhaiticus]